MTCFQRATVGTAMNLNLKNILAIKLKALSLSWIWWVLALMLSFSVNLNAATTTFSFTLDEPCKTSAGVYLPDGTLVRTLWSKILYYAAGTYSSNWDGLDDNGNAVTPGTYQIKLLEHNTEYVWDGAIGNTSAQLSGPTIHSGFYTMHDMAISGTNAFYVSGYNEGKFDFTSFLTSDAQTVVGKWSANGGNNANIYDRDWNYITSDGNHIYCAAPISLDPTNLSNTYRGFVVSTLIGTNIATAFINGVVITNGAGSYPSGVYVGTQSGLSGLAVQQNGNLLAVAVSPDNKIYLLDKYTGNILSNFTVTSPGRMSFDTNGNLWVISGTSILNYTNVNVSPALAQNITGFIEPLAIAASPSDPNLLLVADGGSSQQVKAFNSVGASLWTYGLAGGYQTNGIAVATNKFWFSYDLESIDGTLLCFAPDGSFWVGDGGNHRVMHFDSNRNYIEQIMYQTHSYTTCVDRNNPSRVFNQFLEFSVDYTKPLGQSWSLVNNWAANLPNQYIHGDTSDGFVEVCTFNNGRTYGLSANTTYQFTPLEIVELTTNGVRSTGNLPVLTNSFGEGRGWVSIYPDGSIRKSVFATSTWYESTLSGFDSSNNPTYSPESILTSFSSSVGDPYPDCCSFGNVDTPITTNNILISFNQSLDTGFHLGGVKVGGTNWLWKVAPAGDLNGHGTYEISNGVTYGGNTVRSVDRNIVYGYHGEFFRSEGQASQHMHYYDDGLFVGQFGEASPGHSTYEGVVPGFAGNAFAFDMVKTNNSYYLWGNDESGYTPQRWHLVNAGNIREIIGIGTLGTSFALTNQPYNFPIAVTGLSGDKNGEITWNIVRGASSYDVRYSTMNGGPYQTLAGNTTTTSFVASGLTNGVTYYFSVTAVIGGSESTPSEQVAITPFDTSHAVLGTGEMAEAGQFTPVIDVSSNAPELGQPAYLGNQHLAGVLSLRDLCDYGYGTLMDANIGTKGYYFYNWGGSGSDLSQVLSPFTVAASSGFINAGNLERQYKINGFLGENNGLLANSVGSINISVSDTNFHFLTVVSPAVFNDPRKFTLTLTSTDSTSAGYIVNESPGLSHTFQFLFKGNVTLTADATGGANAIVQGLFFDDAPVGSSISTPTGLRIQSATGK